MRPSQRGGKTSPKRYVVLVKTKSRNKRNTTALGSRLVSVYPWNRFLPRDEIVPGKGGGIIQLRTGWDPNEEEVRVGRQEARRRLSRGVYEFMERAETTGITRVLNSVLRCRENGDLSDLNQQEKIKRALGGREKALRSKVRGLAEIGGKIETEIKKERRKGSLCKKKSPGGFRALSLDPREETTKGEEERR